MNWELKCHYLSTMMRKKDRLIQDLIQRPNSEMTKNQFNESKAQSQKFLGQGPFSHLDFDGSSQHY